MRSSSIIFLGLAVGAASAYKVPEGLKDGVYMGVKDAKTGQDTAIWLSDLSDESSEHLRQLASVKLSERNVAASPPGDHLRCDTEVLLENDIGNAAYALGQDCDVDGLADRGDLTTPHGNRFAVAGDAMAYHCNYYDYGVQCNSADLNTAVQRLEVDCGDRAGEYTFAHNPKPYITYGYRRFRDQICAHPGDAN